MSQFRSMTTDLFRAAKSGDVAVLVKALTEGEVTDVECLNEEGDSLAHIAVRKGHLQVPSTPSPFEPSTWRWAVSEAAREAWIGCPRDKRQGMVIGA